MSVKTLLYMCVLIFVTSSVNALDYSTPAGLEYCTVCHGSQLKGNVNIGAPRLSGLPQWYVERQLQNFKDDQERLIININELLDNDRWDFYLSIVYNIPHISVNRPLIYDTKSG